MKLDPKKFTTDESRSNPMVVAQVYPDCPINEVCVYMVVGFGTIAKQCPHLADTEECAVCNWKKD